MLLSVPVVVMVAITFFTNINIGLRYVLPIFPFVMISAGKVAPWVAGLKGRASRWVAGAVVGLCLTATATATLAIHPHYLAYFNVVSGGPTRGPEHLIDSNIDWGQDLVNLRRWLDDHAPGERVGIAYFGQINPGIFALRGEGLDWFLPPALPGTMRHPAAAISRPRPRSGSSPACTRSASRWSAACPGGSMTARAGGRGGLDRRLRLLPNAGADRPDRALDPHLSGRRGGCGPAFEALGGADDPGDVTMR